MDDLLRRKIERLFAPEDRAEAERLVEQCRALPFLKQPTNRFRTQAAVLKLSAGTLDGLRKALAIRDWRDILVRSGFQSTQACDDFLNE